MYLTYRNIILLFCLAMPCFCLGQNSDDSSRINTFRIRRFGCRPIASITGIWSEGNIKKEDLLSAGRIELEDCDTLLNHIISFDVTIEVDGDMGERMEKGSTFTKDLKALINKTNLGSAIMFHHIQCKGPDGRISSLNVIILHIL